MKTITHGRGARDRLLHVEADGCIVNIHVGLTDLKGRHVTRVDVIPDDERRGGDADGFIWYADGPRVIRLEKGEARPSDGQSLDPSMLDLSGLAGDELLALVRRVNEEYYSRSESAFLEELKKALADSSEVQEYAGMHGQATLVEFSTTDWDNGWFFDEHSPSIVFADGTQYECSIDSSRDLSHAMAQVSHAHQPLGATATYVVNLLTGEGEQDDYGDAGIIPLVTRVTETGIVHIGSTPGEQYGWECAECDEISGLQWGSESDAQMALDHHIEELHSIDAEG